MAEKKEPSAPAPEPVAAPPPAAASSVLKTWLPVIVALVLAPAVTWAVGQFVLLPKLRASLEPEAAASVAGAAAPAHGTAPAKHAPAKHGEAGPKDGAASGPSYRFDNVVVNLSGTMGTRYLKTSFMVTGSDPALVALFDAARPQLGDITLAVLASLSLADLEEAGSKNIIREKLIAAYNQALGRKVAENLYFSDFVVQ